MGFIDALLGKTDRQQQMEAAEHARFSRLQDLTQGFEILLAVGVKLLEEPSRPSVAKVAEFELLYRKQVEALKEHDANCRKHDELLSRSEGATRDPDILKYEQNVRPYVGDLRFKVDDVFRLLQHPDGLPAAVAARPTEDD